VELIFKSAWDLFAWRWSSKLAYSWSTYCWRSWKRWFGYSWGASTGFINI